MTSSAGLLRLFAAAGAPRQEVTFVVHDDKSVGPDGTGLPNRWIQAKAIL